MSNHGTVSKCNKSLSLGSIKPSGWLKNQIQIHADGFTGHLEEHWADVGPNNEWLGGSGESWERGLYYLDGLLPLAYLLDNQKLIDKANRWIEWVLIKPAGERSLWTEKNRKCQSRSGQESGLVALHDHAERIDAA